MTATLAGLALPSPLSCSPHQTLHEKHNQARATWHAHAHAHVRTCTHMHTLTHTHAHIRTHARTHTRVQTRTRTQTHAHAHTRLFRVCVQRRREMPKPSDTYHCSARAFVRGESKKYRKYQWPTAPAMIMTAADVVKVYVQRQSRRW
jgi:hypothetical protein